MWFLCRLEPCLQEDADKMAKSMEPQALNLKEQSDPGLLFAQTGQPVQKNITLETLLCPNSLKLPDSDWA